MAEDETAATFDEAAATRLRRAYSTPTVVEQRRRTRARLAAQPGERLLDLGCGPGLLALELAGEVGPDGAIIALDPSPSMRTVASDDVRRRGLDDRVLVTDGDAIALPLEQGELDGAVAVQVLEHVTDVAAALTELHRVLRPGGRLLVVDTDWRSCVWHAADPERAERVIAAWRSHYAHPQLPVELEAALGRAGFDEIVIEPLPLLEHRTDVDTFGLGMVGTIAAYVADHPAIGAQEAAAWRQDVRDRAADGTYFFGLCRYLFTARR